MTDTELLDRLTRDLTKAITSHETAMVERTDTGLMWRSMAYKECLAVIERDRDRPPSQCENCQLSRRIVSLAESLLAEDGAMDAVAHFNVAFLLRDALADYRRCCV